MREVVFIVYRSANEVIVCKPEDEANTIKDFFEIAKRNIDAYNKPYC